MPERVTLVLALAILGGMSLAVSVIANEPAAYIGVAGTAVGALAAAVAATYKTDPPQGGRDVVDETKEEPPSD